MNYLAQNAGYPNMFVTILFVAIPAEAGIQTKLNWSLFSTAGNPGFRIIRLRRSGMTKVR